MFDPGLRMFGDHLANAQTINILHIFKTDFDVILFYFSPPFAHFIIFFLSRFVQSWIEISFSNLRVRIKCFVVKRMRICNTTMAVHGFQNSKKPILGEVVLQFVQLFRLGGSGF